MINMVEIIKNGFLFTRPKLKLFFVVLCSTIILMQCLDYIFKKNNEASQLLYLLMILIAENFLTCGVYGSLSKILLKHTLTLKMFLNSALKFFMRFLFIKLIFVIFVTFIAGLLELVAVATGEISIPAATGIILLWLVWLAFPVYYFVLSLFAPIVLFSENSGILNSLKTSIKFSKLALDKIIVIAFFYFFAVMALVYLPEKAYNLSSWLWLFWKGIIVSFFEIGFISSFLLLYQQGWNNERERNV